MAEMRSPAAQTRRSTKGERIALRATREQRDLLARASEASSTTVTDFVLGASIARAEEVLADRREFRLPPERWTAFVEMLDRPPVEKARLRRFLTEPSILER
jgi:uncharacterized protein (DUF1778 family)